MKIRSVKYKWAHDLWPRSGPPPYIVWHHAAAKKCSPLTVHKWHLARGYSGIGYHLVVRKNGAIYRGRPLWAMGAHALGANSGIGVLAEGNYDVEKKMPAKQLAALQEVHDWLAKRYPNAKHIGHRGVPGATTVCPGKHYPMKAVKDGVQDAPGIKLTAKHISVPRMNKVKAGWRTVGFKGWYERLKKEGKGHRVVVYADHVILPVPERLPWWWDEMLEWRKGRTVIIRTRKKPAGWWRRRKP